LKVAWPKVLTFRADYTFPRSCGKWIYRVGWMTGERDKEKGKREGEGERGRTTEI
jgi:hypothetical protein